MTDAVNHLLSSCYHNVAKYSHQIENIWLYFASFCVDAVQKVLELHQSG